ncbi:hypothetical protein PHJA_000249800 [Phtheirospermum japonicum]|uniref:Uncharacterized protein n=1 Tax=Phtheirospermum japonicum TaxID=374723 RepID=A0A830BAM8_9LAMI|nr:hypothetical protein PHJA_000249800 [Phtheirospermum japonicum]
MPAAPHASLSHILTIFSPRPVPLLPPIHLLRLTARLEARPRDNGYGKATEPSSLRRARSAVFASSSFLDARSVRSTRPWRYVGGSAILSYNGSGGGSYLGMTSGSVVALKVLLVKGNCQVGCNSRNAHFVLTIEAFEKIAIWKDQVQEGGRIPIHDRRRQDIPIGGLNSLDASDYSSERWNNIVKYYEELEKPSPKVEVTNFLKGREYTDAKSFLGEGVQGTCKYGTPVDYIMGSPGLS